MTAADLRTRRSRHFDSLEQEAFLSLWRTYDRLRIEEDRLFGGYDLTPQQYNALRILRALLPAGAIQRLVAMALGIPRPGALRDDPIRATVLDGERNKY